MALIDFAVPCRCPYSVGQDQKLGTPVCAYQPPQTLLLAPGERPGTETLTVTSDRTQCSGWATIPSGHLFSGMHCHLPFPAAARITWLALSHPRMHVLEGQRH